MPKAGQTEELLQIKTGKRTNFTETYFYVELTFYFSQQWLIIKGIWKYLLFPPYGALGFAFSVALDFGLPYLFVEDGYVFLCKSLDLLFQKHREIAKRCTEYTDILKEDFFAWSKL